MTNKEAARREWQKYRREHQCYQSTEAFNAGWDAAMERAAEVIKDRAYAGRSQLIDAIRKEITCLAAEIKE